ncbi:ACT domain [Arabidopsis suecica]|uniref:ACT domain-containing protein ACR n=1 Tax=Arabidopsis suecica TaxID=45249 RepID=A0A8T1Z6Z2_ARASU|nr:ACT domain [Arabidopsis suecica]
MAFSSSIFSVTQFSSSITSRPSSAISRQTHFPAQIASPDLSPALFDDRRKFVGGVMSLLTKSIKNRVYASINSIDSAATPSYPKSEDDDDVVPMPMVMIDQDADPEATIVQLSFGNRLGALIDTMRALKDLGLDVIKGTVSTEGDIKQTKFSITKRYLHCQLSQMPELNFLFHTRDTGRKVEDPDLLEQIRLTIINNLLKYHPECSEQLAMGETFGIKAPEKKIDVDIATHINVKEDGPKRSLLVIETADRPGLVVEMIKVMADINIDVESAEIDTEGLVAKDKFHVSYQGQALNRSLSQVLVNCLRYFLRRPETDIDSY